MRRTSIRVRRRFENSDHPRLIFRRAAADLRGHRRASQRAILGPRFLRGARASPHLLRGKLAAEMRLRNPARSFTALRRTEQHPDRRLQTAWPLQPSQPAHAAVADAHRRLPTARIAEIAFYSQVCATRFFRARSPIGQAQISFGAQADGPLFAGCTFTRMGEAPAG